MFQRNEEKLSGILGHHFDRTISKGLLKGPFDGSTFPPNPDLKRLPPKIFLILNITSC